MNWDEIRDDNTVDDDPTVDPEAMAIVKDIERKLPMILTQVLSPREERIIRMRFGLGTEPQTLNAIAKLFSKQTEQIRQWEAKAIRKLIRAGKTKRAMKHIK